MRSKSEHILFKQRVKEETKKKMSNFSVTQIQNQIVARARDPPTTDRRISVEEFVNIVFHPEDTEYANEDRESFIFEATPNRESNVVIQHSKPKSE